MPSEIASAQRPAFIVRIQVAQLFGRYDYELNPEGGTDPSKLMLLYGDNGSGKTTLLKLIYALLSTHRNRGLKTYISTVPFRSFDITFNDGTHVAAIRDEGDDLGEYTMSVRRPGHRSTICKFEPGMTRHAAYPKFLREMGALGVAFYYLSDDRELASPETDSDHYYYYQHKQHHPETDHHGRPLFGVPTHHEALATIARLDRWFRRTAAHYTRASDAGANDAFVDLLKRLAGAPAASPPDDAESLESQLRRLGELEKRTEAFAKLGLTAPFPGEAMRRAVSGPSEQRSVLGQVLTHFIDSMKARLDAQQPFLDLAELFASTANAFLFDKALQLSLGSGVTIVSSSGTELSPLALSSGERHLLVLLGQTLMARDQTSVFLIDEPELSLNVKWQRKLVDAVLALTADTPGQFVLATHSIELISQHRSQLLVLRPEQ